MSLTVNTNSLALNAQNNLNNNQARLSTVTSATAALTTTGTSIDTINVSSAGAYQNTFAPAATGNLQSSVENMAATLGRIRDEGFAQQSAKLSRMQFTQYPLTAMLAQANQSSHDVLALLR